MQHRLTLRRLIEALAVFAVIVATLAGHSLWLISDPRLKARAARELRLATGLEVSVDGPVSLALLPSPRLVFEDVTLKSADGGVEARVASAEAAFALLPLIGSRFEFSALTLDRARISVHFGAALALRLDSLTAPERAADDRAMAPRRPLRLALRDSALALLGAGDDDRYCLSGLDVKLDWPSEDGPLSFAGSAQGPDGRLTLSGFAARPGVLRQGGTTPARLELAAQSPSPEMSLRIEGALSGKTGLRFDGGLEAAVASLADLLRPAANSDPAPAGEAVRIAASLSASAAGAELSSVRFELAGSVLEGSLHAAVADAGTPAARLSLSGTLAAAALRLDPLTQLLPQWRDADGKWSAAALDARWLRRTDLDLRVSAASAALGSLKGEDAALSVLVRNGRFNFGLQELRAYGGKARANFAGAFAGERLEAKGEAQFADIGMARLAQDAPGLRRLSGTAQGSIGVTLLGGSIAAIAAGLSGGAQLRFANGEIQGINFEQALRRLERKPGSVPAALASGATAFDSLDLPAKIVNGVARIGEGVMTGPGARAQFKGDIDLDRQRVAVTSVASPAGADAETATPPALTIDISGNLGELAVVPRLVGLGAPQLTAP